MYFTRDLPVVKSELSLISQLQFAVSFWAKILPCGGCKANVINALEQDPDLQTGIQYPFCVRPSDIKKLVYESNFKVLGPFICLSYYRLCCHISVSSWVSTSYNLPFFGIVSLINVASLFSDLALFLIFNDVLLGYRGTNTGPVKLSTDCGRAASLLGFSESALGANAPRQEFEIVDGKLVSIVLFFRERYCFACEMIVLLFVGPKRWWYNLVDEFFEIRIDLCKSLMRDYRESFDHMTEKNIWPRVFLYKQTVNFLHPLLQRIL